MDILFLLKSLDIGGVEVVTSVLANKFVAEGHSVVLWAFYEGKTSLADRLDARVKLIYGHGFHAGKANIISLRKALVDNKVQVVINQWGLPYVPALTLKKASSGLGVKTIAVYHNDPSSNGRIKEVEIALEHCDSWLKRFLLKWKLYVFRQITAASMRYVYHNCDKYFVLSESFISHFKKFTGIKKASKLYVQTNPITLNSEGYKLDFTSKNKEVIYVGRLDNQQKRVYRIIETWALIEKQFPDWRLTIVGDGIERQNLICLVNKLGLQKVYFEGFKEPRPYYERASILALVSEYEGFPLVLAECMSFGVVPIVYDSYSAVHDIIDDGVNGVIVPFNTSGFEPKRMADQLSLLISDEERRKQMSVNAMKKSNDYSLDFIYEQWEATFRTLIDTK